MKLTIREAPIEELHKLNKQIPEFIDPYPLQSTPFYSIANCILAQPQRTFPADFNCGQPCENVLCSNGAFLV